MSGVPDDRTIDQRGGVRVPPPLLFLGGFAVGVSLQLVRPLPGLSFWAALVVGAIAVAAGSALAVPAIARLWRADTTLDPNATATTLVVAGPYRWTRNPIYTGLTLLYIGAAVWSGASWTLFTLIPVVAVIDRAVIAHEERRLVGRFGSDYIEYCARTRRWL